MNHRFNNAMPKHTFLRTTFRFASLRRVSRSVSLLLLALLLSNSAAQPALARAKHPTASQLEAFRQMRDAHLANMEAEKNLVLQIDKVAAQLKKTIAIQARQAMLSSMLPLDKDSADRLCEDLAKLVGQNPYDSVPRHTFKIAMAGAKPEVPPRVRMQLSTTLLSQQITNFRYSAPDDRTWSAEPGTITIFHNGYDLAAVWGANIDGHPVKDKLANRAKIVKIRLAR